MKNKKSPVKVFTSSLLLTILLFSSILPTVAADTSIPTGFDRGVSCHSYVPLKKTTFVQHDDMSLLDDYSYLASVPTSVFYDTDNSKIYTHPLLYFTEEHDDGEEDKERSLNARQGIDYFMEDWISYCHGYQDEMTLINVPESKIPSEWNSHQTTMITGDTIYDIAADIALHDWSYTKEAVVAVINEDPAPANETTFTNSLTNTISTTQGIKTEHFEVPKTNEVYPTYHDFTVPDGYKMLRVRSWYPCFYIDAGIPGFEGIINMSIPAGDRDLQIYTMKNGQRMMAGLTNAWNAQGGMDRDKTSVYVYNSGTWSVSLTDVPTKAQGTYGLFDIFGDDDDDTMMSAIEPQKHRQIFTIGFGRYGRIIDIIRSMRQVIYQVDVEMYPGMMMDIPDMPPYGCRNAKFELSWEDSSVKLGFSLIGPNGEEILSTRESGVSSKCSFPAEEGDLPIPEGSETDLHVNQLGECLPGEHYSISVYALNDVETTTEFTLEYSWDQNITREQGDMLASATEGAVLGSILNAPLLYTDTTMLPEATKEALLTLGVEKIHLVDLGDYGSTQLYETIERIAPVDQQFTHYEDIYSFICSSTGQHDIIFSTVDPWSYWYVGDLEVAGEYEGAMAVGPAAYIAAHHGSPVLLIENHPELSSAIVWHNELWRRHPDGHSRLPTVSEMYLTGSRVYDFLKDLDFDKEGMENVITVGGQFDIGLPWDRVFVGKAKPGRFFGSPTDLSVWIAKNVFYPQLIFENPGANNPTGVTMINGSSSKRRFPYKSTLGLKITKPSQEETFTYPVLDTLICYDHKFNSRASKYWGFTYKCADGTIPGVTQSLEPIDEGVMVNVNGETGGYFADLSGSEVQPFYLRQAGYDPVFSTNFEANMNNLNQGVIMWMINTHGGPNDGGLLMFWDVEGNNPRGYPPIPLAGYNKETNPWRGYEWLMGSTAEPDTMTSEIHGILPALVGNPDPRGGRVFTTALDWAVAYRPIRDLLGNIASLPLLRLITPEWFQDTQDYYDGVIITVFLGRFGTSWYTGVEIDDAIDNIHSCGVSSVACLPAGKYLHLTLMRHGSPYQIMDPWATSWYSDVWQNSVPRGAALGKTIGEIYTEGISKVGILYITEPPQWWWDLAENVCLYGDPNLRIWVPSTEFGEDNHWKPADVRSLQLDEDAGFAVDGHMPFGADEYPHLRSGPSEWTMYVFIGVLAVIIIGLLILAVVSLRKKE